MFSLLVLWLKTCELVGAFLLQNIQEKHGKNFGLYRDDGLGISNASPRKVELIKKDLCTILRNHGLKITIEANKKTVNFLDVTLDLSNGKYMPYTKHNLTTHHFTSTENLITRLASSTTSLSLLIIDSLRFPVTKTRLKKRHHCTRKLLTTADIHTTFNIHSLRQLNP